MTLRPFSTNSNYQCSLRGLHRLHTLALAGRNDDPEADAVRSSLERPWRCLSEAERKRIAGLSADLDSIDGPPEEIEPMNPQAQRKLIEAHEAQRAGEWDKALELLRHWGKHLDVGLLCYMRGRIWQEAGDFATAALFFGEASRLEPDNDSYAALHLGALARSDPTSALEQAQKILAVDAAHAPAVVARAADIRFASTRHMLNGDARDVLQQLVAVLERILARLPADDAKDSIHAMVTALLAFCHDDLGDPRAALRYYNLGLAANPHNDALLVARGILRYGASPAAVEDFEQAIRCGSAVVWPYFFLAHYYLVSDRFDDCRRMCERALDVRASGAVRSNLNEWLGISRSELGFPPDLVRSAFEEAIRLDPGNERIQRNFRAFEECLAQTPNPPPAWAKPLAVTVQAFGHAEYQHQPALAA